MINPFFRIAAVAMIAWLALAACGGNGQPDPGFIRVADFKRTEADLRAWQFIHHASHDSYELTVSDGSAAITRIGHEPWATLTQSISPEHIERLAGQRLAFSIDLKGALEDETWGDPIEPTGLTARMQQRPGAQSRTHALLGSRRSRSERLPLPADALMPDWQRHTLEFDAPDDLEKLEVGVIMTNGGTLELRHPSLTIVGDPGGSST